MDGRIPDEQPRDPRSRRRSSGGGPSDELDPITWYPQAILGAMQDAGRPPAPAVSSRIRKRHRPARTRDPDTVRRVSRYGQEARSQAAEADCETEGQTLGEAVVPDATPFE